MKNQLFILLLVLSIGGSFAGAFLKIMHIPGADILLAASLVGGLVFAVMALIEILPAPIQKTEKLMWVIVFIFLNWLAVILHVAVGRNRIMQTHKKILSV